MAYTRAVIRWNKNVLLRSCLEDMQLKIEGGVASPSMHAFDVIRGDVAWLYVYRYICCSRLCFWVYDFLKQVTFRCATCNLRSGLGSSYAKLAHWKMRKISKWSLRNLCGQLGYTEVWWRQKTWRNGSERHWTNFVKSKSHWKEPSRSALASN